VRISGFLAALILSVLRKLSLQRKSYGMSYGKSVSQAECMPFEIRAAPHRRGNLYVARRSNAAREPEKRTLELMASP
jgi:hypothetical protein